MAEHPSFGSTLKWDRTGGTSYTSIGQVASDIGVPSFSRGTIDVTNHASTDGYKEFMPGLTDPGQLTFTVNFDPADATHVYTTGLLEDFDNDGCTLAAWEFTMNVCTASVTSSVWTFDGFLVGADMNAPLEGVHSMDVTVQISGKPTLTIATP